MLAMAAARLGLKTHIYCEDSGPAFDVATATTKAGFDDKAALDRVRRAPSTSSPTSSRTCRSSTAQHLAGLRAGATRRAKALEVAQDRLAEKKFIAALGIPVAPFAAVDGEQDLRSRARRTSMRPRS